MQVLSDDNKRQMYDATGHSQYTAAGGMPGGGGRGAPFTTHQAEEIFRQFFGGGGFGSMFDQDFATNSHQLVLHLTFNEAVRGCEKEVSMRVQARCDRCFGTGGEPGTKEQICPYCRGTGEVSPVLSPSVFVSSSKQVVFLLVFSIRYSSLLCVSTMVTY